jgi:hypothetical protein
VISLTKRHRTESSPGPRRESAAIQWIITLERAEGRKQWTHESAAALLIFQARLGP